MEDFDEGWEQSLPTAIPQVVTTKEVQEAIARVHTLAVQKANIENELSKINKLIMSAERLTIALLESAGMEEFPSEFGKFSLKEKSSLSMKDVDKEKLFQYLRDTGRFDSLASIHAQTFVGWYNEEEEKAREEGREMEFSIPGVPTPKMYKQLKYKKPKSDTES